MSEVLEYKCPCCGGAIQFDTASQQMKCPYCDNIFDLSTLRSYEEEMAKDAGDNMDWGRPTDEYIDPSIAEGMRVYSCQSCGAQIVSDENTAASSCPFCGNPVVMGGQLSGELKPDLVIPFKLDKNQAKQALLNYYKDKKLLPRTFTNQNHIDEIKGVYIPFWLFDADANAHMRYDASTVRRWSDEDFDYTETSHYLVTRSGRATFSNIPVDGDTKFADDLTESIEPFDYSQAVDFQTAYLSGFFADKFNVPAEECVPRANQRARESVEDFFRSTVSGYSSVVPANSSIRLSNGKVKYALLPVWMLTTRYNGTPYTFAMNGQTGKFVGNLPVDKGLYWKGFAIRFAGIAAAVYALSWLLRLL
ncbi:MAG: hypothetical protein K5629_03880 [Eubacteriales bacterium]|nr:hypothetical protein [Eubacteriales bacterium]